ncbi:hypothetical protein [Chryseobacterium oncorhynchi]|uniref:Uncharacterized protein n=1 Tax=Chryseobacterium oncorhynchi TaxID=741074 RepID=A0A316WI74_9FLAO|nr:hypothetical protein [Chryseobacterium oncorhynchi]PWN59986.1 hypothetical protein C1638_020680 [Chryseobacterium oncorhynchi]
MKTPDKKSRVSRTYRYTIETIILIEKLADLAKRSNTNYVETIILNTAELQGFSVSEEDIKEFFEKQNVKSKK